MPQINMVNKNFNFLIMGAGVVGQIYGAYLKNAGHNVTFLTREKHLNKFQQEGINIQLKGRDEKLKIKNCKFVSEINSLSEIDFLFICFRSDQRDDAGLLLKELDCSKTHLVVCFPIWKRSSLGYENKFSNSLYLYPGIAGIYKNGEILFEKWTTKIAPLGNFPSDEVIKLTSILLNAGLPSKFSPHLINDFQITLCLVLPLLAAVSTKGYNINDAAGDKELLMIAIKSQKECLNIIRACGDYRGLRGNLFTFTPTHLLYYILKIANPFIRGFSREMIEIHFKKVHNQTIFLLKELSSFPFASNVKKDNLLKLISMCEPDSRRNFL